MIALGKTERKGRGVFAQRAFTAGELIEHAPVLIIPAGEWKFMEHTMLYHYSFCWGENGEHAALAMGLGSFYNHSWTPNAEYVKHLSKDTIDFVARVAIAAGQEITVNYNGTALDRTPIWFEVKE